jgi:DNA-binding NarL/FixJ family response regulator
MGNWCDGPTNDITGNMSSARVLVVEDHEPFRRYICSTLERSLDFWIVGEVSDGLQAVHQAEVLQPDLILLDIGLPTLNGIEAARRIRQLSPKSKILFVSQESSPDVIEEALSSGALGYVVKANAAREFLPAVEAVLQGKRFIGRGLAGQGSTDSRCAPVDLVADSSDGIFRVEMDSPMPVDLPEEEQIRHIIYASYVAYCNDCQARMYGLASAQDLIGKRMADMVVPDDPKNIELTRAFIRSGYEVLERKSYELDSQGNPKVFLNSMRGVVIAGELVLTWGVQSDITERSFKQ